MLNPPTVRKIQVGLGGPYVSITAASAHTAFSAAIAELASSGGGELIVYPGYAELLNPPPPVKYRFGSPVSVSVPNVTILFAPGAVLDFTGTTASEMFLVSAPGFRVVGAVVEHQAVQLNGRSCFRIQEPTTPGQDSHGAAFVDCSFRIGQSVSSVLGFSCIRAEGLDSKVRRGLEVSGCTFEILPGTAAPEAWQQPDDEPYGICAIRARNSEGCLLTENRFHGPPGTQKAPCGPMILLDNAERSVIASSVFENLDLIPAAQAGSTPPGGSVVRVTSHSTFPGHHTSVSSNVFRSIDARYVLEIVGCRSDLVTANHFGAIGHHCDAVLRARGTGGKALTVFGNVFQGVSGAGTPATLGRMLHLEGLESATIDGNAFTDGPAGRRMIELEPGTCSNVHVGPSQVLRSLTS